MTERITWYVGGSHNAQHCPEQLHFFKIQIQKCLLYLL